MNESKLQKAVIETLKNNGAYVIRNAYATKSGVPDLTVCIKGKFIAIELKKPGIIKLREVQKRNGNSIIKAGGIFRVINSIEELENLLKEIE